MGKFKLWLAKKLLNLDSADDLDIYDAGASSRDPTTSVVKRVGLRMGDVTSKDFEDPEFDLTQIQTGYNTDSYIRQGVDKYVDQIFKEGFEFYGKNEQAVEYIKLRLAFVAEATKTPTSQLLTDIAEDVVKFSNCFLAKVRVKDANALPPGVTVAGIGGLSPVGGYFCINATTMKTKRDKTGLVTGYQQEVDGADKPVTFKPDDMVHFVFKREKGNSFGTPFLWPVLDDVRALRQAEENVLRMMYRNIHPFNHIQVGSDEIPGTDSEIADVQDAINNMDVEGGIITSNRVKINPIASDQVIDAEPYLDYLEARVFTGMGIPAILFGRGDTSNRSTGDSMTSEMSDRIKAIQKTIEAVINGSIINELLLEGGYDAVLNPDDTVLFKFKENDMDSMIKFENHVVFKFEHNAITEDEMRLLLNMDPIQDRSLLMRELQLQTELIKVETAAAVKPATTGSSTSKTTSKAKTSTKAVDNKSKPTNQHGTKSSPKKTSDSNSYDDDVELIDFILYKDLGKEDNCEDHNN